MEILNIFIAVVVVIAVGFWNFSSKEQIRMVKKASFTRTLILLLLTAWCTFFYYKTYQVATFRNKIEIKASTSDGKGDASNVSYYESYYDDDFADPERRREIDSIKNDSNSLFRAFYKLMSIGGAADDEYSFSNVAYGYSKEYHHEKKVVIPDTVKSLVILNSFSEKEKDLSDPFVPGVFYHKLSFPSNDIESTTSIKSGVFATLQFDNRLDSVLPKQKEIYNRDEYNIHYYTNSIPQLLPYLLYELTYPYNNLYNDSNRREVVVGKDYDRHFEIDFYNSNKSEEVLYKKGSAFNKFINTLNFFSAADLTQCEYRMELTSDLPIEQFCMFFDIPVEISSIDVLKEKAYDYKEGFDLPDLSSVNIPQNNVSSRGFSIHLEEGDDGKINSYLHFMVSFPTLANLQLIRSLILTTVLTALLSITLANMYFLSRKIYLLYLRKRMKSYAFIKDMLWTPYIYFVKWSFIVIIAYLLYRSVFNHPILININATYQAIILIIIGFVLYILLLFIALYLMYKKGIYLTTSNIKSWLKSFLLKLKLFFRKKRFPSKKKK